MFSPAQAEPRAVILENLTWMEVRDRIASGETTIIIPTGGTEQNGPHMALGKHNRIVSYAAEEIAATLGKTLVAPTLAYVPQGNISPPEGQMRFSGTLSVSEKTFRAVLKESAESLKTHGFRLICFLGDSGGNQAVQKELAEDLTEEWEEYGVKVLHVSDYYAQHGQTEYLKSRGFSESDIGKHAGMEDSSELMAIDAGMIRTQKLAAHGESDFSTTGAWGNSSKATADLGRELLKLKIDAAVNQITAARNTQ